MIKYKMWAERESKATTVWEGWFLFGFIPLYIKQMYTGRVPLIYKDWSG